MKSSMLIAAAAAVLILTSTALSKSKDENCMSLFSEREPALPAKLDKTSISSTLRAEEIIKVRCGKCHIGPFLNLSSQPFYSDRFKDPEDLARAIVDRIACTNPKLQPMPPVNATPLSPAEIEKITSWSESFVR